MAFTKSDLAKLMGEGVSSGAQGENQYVKGAQEQALSAQQSAQTAAQAKQSAATKAGQEGATRDTNLDVLNAYITGGKLPNGQTAPKLPPTAGLTIGADGKIEMSKQANLGIQNLQQERQQSKQENAYAGKLEKYSDATGALGAIEDTTNADQKGGVLTNPDAQLKSFGPVASKMSDQQVALAEGLHMLPQGAAEERKAVSRYQLALGHALTGARMNPTMQGMIKDSMGQLASGDPQLVAKGIRGSANILGSTLNTVQSGFDDNTRNTVHDRLGGDPADLFSKVYKDGPAGSVAQTPAPQQAAPQPQQDPGYQRYMQLQQKMKQTQQQQPPQAPQAPNPQAGQ